jgi:hypothetical protein
MKVRERLTVRLGFRRTPAMCTQMSISGEAPVVGDDDGCADDVRKTTAVSGT